MCKQYFFCYHDKIILAKYLYGLINKKDMGIFIENIINIFELNEIIEDIKRCGE